MLIDVYVASPDPNPRGGSQLPNPNEYNSTLTSGTNNIYPYPYIDVKATFHLTISMRGQRAMGKIQRNNYHHGRCRTSLTGKTMSVFLIFTQGTHRNVKNR